MAGDILPITLRTRRELAKRGQRGRLFDWLNYNSVETFKIEDDFMGDIAVATREPGWDTDAGSGATAAALVSAAVGGTVALVTGATSDIQSALYLGGGGHFTGDNNPRMTARVKVSNIATVKMEVGFTDVTTDVGAINVLNTPTATADDCAVAIFDTSATSATWQFAGARTTTAWTYGTTGATPVADTYDWITVALNRVDLATDNMNAYLWINGVLRGKKELGAIANTVKLWPYILVQSRTTSSRTMTCDYLGAWADRSTGGL